MKNKFIPAAIFLPALIFFFSQCTSPSSQSDNVERLAYSYTIGSIRDMAGADSAVVERITEAPSIPFGKEKIRTEILLYNPKVFAEDPGIDAPLTASGLAMMLYNNYGYDKLDTSEQLIVKFMLKGKEVDQNYTVGEIKTAKDLFEQAHFYYNKALDGYYLPLLKDIDTTLASRDTCLDILHKIANSGGTFVIGGFKETSLTAMNGKKVPGHFIVSQIISSWSDSYEVVWFFSPDKRQVLLGLGLRRLPPHESKH